MRNEGKGCGKWIRNEHEETARKCGTTIIDETFVGGDKYFFLCSKCKKKVENEIISYSAGVKDDN